MPGALCTCLIVLAAAPIAEAAPDASGTARCVGERWQVGTLTDPAAGDVSLAPQKTTVTALGRLSTPKRPGRERIKGIETVTYRIKAQLIEMRLERNGDIFLAVVDPSSHATMVVEFPALACIQRAAPRVRALMRTARAALVAACGEPDHGSFTRVGGAATITGVGFASTATASETAPNGLELRPVLGFRIADCVLGAG